MADMRQAFPSDYLSAKDIQETGPKKVTISSVTSEQIRGDNGLEDKWVLGFDGARKRLILNVTNNNTLIDAFGYESNDWLGKAVTMFTVDVQFGSKMVLGLRLKIEAPKPATQAHEPVGEDAIPF